MISNANVGLKPNTFSAGRIVTNPAGAILTVVAPKNKTANQFDGSWTVVKGLYVSSTAAGSITIVKGVVATPATAVEMLLHGDPGNTLGTLCYVTGTMSATKTVTIGIPAAKNIWLPLGDETVPGITLRSNGDGGAGAGLANHGLQIAATITGDVSVMVVGYEE